VVVSWRESLSLNESDKKVYIDRYGRSPLYIGISFYSWLLCEYPALAEIFCEDEGDDGETVGPVSLQIEKLALRHETLYHR